MRPNIDPVHLLAPTFREGDLILFPVMRAHWADVGVMTPGSYSGEERSISRKASAYRR